MTARDPGLIRSDWPGPYSLDNVGQALEGVNEHAPSAVVDPWVASTNDKMVSFDGAVHPAIGRSSSAPRVCAFDEEPIPPWR